MPWVNECGTYPALCLGAITIPGRRVPRAPLPGLGVTHAWVSSRDTSEGVTPPSSLLRAHAPVHAPPDVFSLNLIRQVFAGCCQPLLVHGPSRLYLRNPCRGAWTLTPRCPSGALARFFPKGLGLTLDLRGSARPSSSCIAASAGHVFRSCSHSFMFRLPCLLGPQTSPTASFSRWAAGPFTPRIGHAVTGHDLWYRYLPESGKWQDGTFTRWIAALSAAPRIRT